MKAIEVEVKNRKEALAIKSALDDPTTHAFVLVVGYLKPFSKRAQTRIISFVKDKLDEEDELARISERALSEAFALDKDAIH
jgi:hypothetical protein